MDVFSIAPGRLGGLDMLTPLFGELKAQRPDTRIRLIFVEDRPYHDLEQDRFLSAEVSRLVDGMTRLKRGATSGPAGKFVEAGRLAPVAARLAATPNSLLLHSRSLASPLVRILHRANRVRGGRTLAHFNGLALTLGRQPETRVDGRLDGDGFMCFSRHDLDYLRAMGRDKAFPVGYPRLYPTWLDRVRRVAPGYVNEELVRLGLSPDEILVSLFLGSTVETIFSRADLEKWLREAVGTVRRRLPRGQLLVKPHPMQDRDHLQAVLKDLDDPGLAVSHLHPSLVAARSRVVIAHHTSTIIDALAVGTPTIQFQEFPERWLKKHPEGSAFLKLGPLAAQTAAELAKRLDQALAPDFRPAPITEILDHRTDLSPLFGAGEAGRA